MRYNILPLRRHPTLLALAFDCHCINTCWVSVHSAVFEFIFKIIFDCRDMTWNNVQNCAVVCLYKKERKIFFNARKKREIIGICIFAHSMQSWFHVQITFWNCFFQDLIWKFYVKFRFSKKATKFETISHMIWRLHSKCQIKWEIVSNFCGLFRMSEL